MSDDIDERTPRLDDRSVFHAVDGKSDFDPLGRGNRF
jgi:hypothetical protein